MTREEIALLLRPHDGDFHATVDAVEVLVRMAERNAIASEEQKKRDNWKRWKRAQRSGDSQGTPVDSKSFKRSKNTNTKQASVDSQWTSACEAFWKAYPRRGRSRSSTAETWASWRKQGCEERAADIMAALAIWKRCEDWARNNGGAIPGVHRFLTRRSWENPPAAPAAQAYDPYQ